MMSSLALNMTCRITVLTMLILCRPTLSPNRLACVTVSPKRIVAQSSVDPWRPVYYYYAVWL